VRWRTGRRSTNVEDRRGSGGGFGLPRGVTIGGGSGCGLLVILAIGMLLGLDPMQLLQELPTTPSVEPPSGYDDGAGTPPGPQDERADFVSVVLADTEDAWSVLFAQAGATYEPPVLTLFEGVVQSACGFGQSASGPFYCPADQHVYIDLSFYDELRSTLGAPGDFAEAYVIAHEVGHHVQNLLGVSRQAQELQSRLDEAEANAVSVRVELQADCYAGVWAHHAERMRQVLEPGDIEEALGAASAIGDDRLQRRMGGRVVPDSFTHGTSEQRERWFREGFESGDLSSCDTFSVPHV
jgi:predicted metalloprotease